MNFIQRSTHPNVFVIIIAMVIGSGIGLRLANKVEMTQTILNTVWSWLTDEQHELNGLICEFEEKIVTFAHYRRNVTVYEPWICDC